MQTAMHCKINVFSQQFLTLEWYHGGKTPKTKETPHVKGKMYNSSLLILEKSVDNLSKAGVQC